MKFSHFVILLAFFGKRSHSVDMDFIELSFGKRIMSLGRALGTAVSSRDKYPPCHRNMYGTKARPISSNFGFLFGKPSETDGCTYRTGLFGIRYRYCPWRPNTSSRSAALTQDCNESQYKCHDMTCIPLASKCDGKYDCPDRSDEADAVCESVRPKCVLPSYPEHGSYVVWGQPDARPGDKLDNAVLTVTCNPSYLLVGPTTPLYCYRGQWYSYAAAMQTCKPSLSCGIPSGAQALIMNGRMVKDYEMPWHAGIYDKSSGQHKQICGGSLVSQRLVISAAHCFWDDVAHQLPHTRYAVSLGQLMREWKDQQDRLGQWFDVSSIKLPEEFNGETTSFQADIALVFLDKPAVFTDAVQPVCMDLDSFDSDQRQLTDGNPGKIAGWGLTAADGDSSDVLMVNQLPAVSNPKCRADSHYDFRRYIIWDKICAGNLRGNGLCRGDSGGGLVFRDEGTGAYHLRGVASVRYRNSHACSIEGYTAFTRVFYYAYFIKNNNK